MATKKPFLTLEDILGAEDRGLIPIDVPEWGGRVNVKPMDSFTRTLYESKMYQMTKGKTIDEKQWQLVKIRVVAQCLYTPEGVLMFNPQNEEQWMKLGSKNAIVISRIFEKCLAISGIGEKSEGE